jgi:hypothetical protein
LDLLEQILGHVNGAGFALLFAGQVVSGMAWPLLWGELSSASENYFFLLNALLFVFLSLCFLPLIFGSSPLVERRPRDLA